MYPQEITEILQGSIAPVVMISGIGLLLLSMTNRLSRPVDRIHTLLREKSGIDPLKIPDWERQIKLLYHRCKILRIAIALSIMSILFVSTIILTLFITHFISYNLSSVIKLLFTLSLTCLISSLFFFMLDIKETLNSLHIEIKSHLDF